MKETTLTIDITFTEPLLATASGNHEIHEEFIASRAAEQSKTDEEVSTVPVSEQIEKSSTVFMRDEKGIFTYDYTWKGHIKETVGHLCELGEFKKLTKWTFKRAIDGSVFVMPRRVYLTRDGVILQKPDGTIQRPLRATTMQGDRVALARSEFVSAGTIQKITVRILESTNTKSTWSEINADLIRTVFGMGDIKGTGQWRGGSFGRYSAVVK